MDFRFTKIHFRPKAGAFQSSEIHDSFLFFHCFSMIPKNIKIRKLNCRCIFCQFMALTVNPSMPKKKKYCCLWYQMFQKFHQFGIFCSAMRIDHVGFLNCVSTNQKYRKIIKHGWGTWVPQDFYHFFVIFSSLEVAICLAVHFIWR